MLYSENSDILLEFSDLDEKTLIKIAEDIKKKGMIAKSRSLYYFNQFLTMDIETSKVQTGIDAASGKRLYEAFAYTICLHTGDHCILCRTWEEYNTVMVWLAERLYRSPKYRCVIYVHNLPYEFQFMRSFMNIDKLFATEPRKVVKCLANNFEYRCSYKLTNMGLDRFLKSLPPEKVPHQKQSGEDFDYNKLRTPTTELTPQELQYIYNDVAGLHEGMEYQLESEGDTIATIPLTSTGYVRRHLRDVMNTPENHEKFLEMQLDKTLYGLFRDARRGGNCHCSPICASKIIRLMKSLDMSSAYPAVMVQKMFPMTPFRHIWDTKNFEQYVDDPKTACLLDVTFTNIRIKTLATIPYLPRSICTQIDNITTDNGRILSGDKVSIVLTDIDYQIIRSQYKFDVECNACYCSMYDYLPDELRDELLKMYADKTTLKDSDYYYYMKQKNKFNSTFGCMLTDICQETVAYNAYSTGNPFKKRKERSYTSMLSKYYNNKDSFLSYQHGIWVTAWCRYRLQKAIDLLGENMVYCDTDSVKYKESLASRTLKETLNSEIYEDIRKCGKNCTVEYKGKEYTLGLWEDDGDYKLFKSLGAKKYCYVDKEGYTHITVSGLSKSKAEKWFNEHGGIEKFAPETIVPVGASGRTVSTYNDRPNIITIKVGNEDIQVGANVVITDTTYEFSISEDYEKLITSIGNGGLI